MTMKTNLALQPDMKARVPLYIAGLAASSMGLAALGTVVSDGIFMLLMFVLLALGFYISWMARTGRLRALDVRSIASITLSIIIAVTAMMRALQYQLFVFDVMSARDLHVAVGLAWLMVICSFVLTTDSAVIFICVPSLSIIGLSSTLGPTSDILIYFIFFLAFSCFLMLQHNLISAYRSIEGRIALLARWTITTLVIAFLSLSIGMIVSHILYNTINATFASQIFNPNLSVFIRSFEPTSYAPVATGPAPSSNLEVMTVKCNEDLYWRGQSYDRYTGNAWTYDRLPRDRRPVRPLDDKSTTFDMQDYSSAGKPASVKEVKQTFHIFNIRSHILYAAGEPRTIKFNSPHRLFFSNQRIRIGRSEDNETRYTVISNVSTASPRQLRSASQEYPESIKERYLTVPESTWGLKGLVEGITKNLNNPYDKAMAIQNYLIANYGYDLNAPPTPSGEDAVGYFLFKSRKGYCSIFASSMVVMCRQAGIPARWVTGFSTGEYDKKDKKYHVRLKDAHAWAELYFPGYGWIQFDPTPGGSGNNLIAYIQSTFMRAKSYLSHNASNVIIAALLVIFSAYLVKVELIDRIRRKRTGISIHNPNHSQIFENYAKMCMLLARFGYPKPLSATPLEYASDLDGLFSSDLRRLSSSVEAITNDFVLMRYAARDLSQNTLEANTANLNQLRRDLKDAKKDKLLPV